MLPIFMNRFFTYRNAEVHFTTHGKGALVVLLHGFLEDISIWNGAKKYLSTHYQVACIDLPGHGKTECMGYVHSMELMADVVLELMKHLKKRKCHLVGHSMGGYVALAFAELYPDKISSLGLVCSNARADKSEKKKDRTKAIQLVKSKKKLFVEQAIPPLFYKELNNNHSRAIKKIKSIAHKTSIQGTIAAILGMRDRFEREIVLRFAPYPVLILAGEKDQIIPLEWLKEQAEIAENCQLEIMEDVGHMPFYEAPLLFESKIKRFIDAT
tara:strand:+ start:4194 stop:5000 length:807 start_codon:yes stop_codon:yes gene_type:complete